MPPCFHWTPKTRLILFLLSATSIWSLLSEFYNLMPMRTFTLAILLPSTLALILIAILGDRELTQTMIAGCIGGVLAACAYDLFRLPFVIASIDHIGPHWLRLPLFRVFPQFGALILNQPYTATQTDSQFSLLAHVTGWAYHFSNGISFGIMYLAMIGHASKKSWPYAIALAVGLELAMLLTPYVSFFGIPLTARFVIVTLTAHLIFGVALGFYTIRASRARA